LADEDNVFKLEFVGYLGIFKAVARHHEGADHVPLPDRNMGAIMRALRAA